MCAELPFQGAWKGWRNGLTTSLQNPTRTNSKTCIWSRLILWNYMDWGPA